MSVQRYWDYRICGLHVRSEIVLHGSIACADGQGGPDILVRLGPVPAALEGAVARGPNWQSAPPAFLLEIPGVARLLAEAGRELVVEPLAGIPVEDVSGFVAGTGLALALHQRGALVLHASAVARNGRAFAFAGASGAGKSTLAAMLCREAGCTLVSDDVAVVEADGPVPVLRPDGRRVRLWDDAVTLLALEESRGAPVRNKFRKFHVALPEDGPGDVPCLSGLYLLEALPKGAVPEIVPLTLVEAVAALNDNIYRRALSNRLDGQAARFARIARLLAMTPVFRFRRSPEPEGNARSLALLIAHWETLA